MKTLLTLIAFLLLPTAALSQGALPVLGLPGGGTGNAVGPWASPFTAPGATTPATTSSRSGRFLNIVDDFHAKCDVIYAHDEPTAHVQSYSTTGSPVVSFIGTSFVSADVGKYIVVSGIGAAGVPLASTISHVTSSTQITLATNALTTTSNIGAVIAYGHDDSVSFASAVAAFPKGGRVYIPHAACGVVSAIALPNIYPSVRDSSNGSFTMFGEGRGSSVIVALGSGMDAVAVEPTGWHLGARLVDITLDAMGVATYAYDDVGGYSATGERVSFENGATADVRFGDGTHQEQNAEYGLFDLVNDPVIFPATMPDYGMTVGGTDNMFTLGTSSGASLANFRDTGYSHNFYTTMHGYGPAQYAYWFNGLSDCVGCEVDGATVAGVRYDGGGNSWTGGRLFFYSQDTTSVNGFALYGTTGGNRIIHPTVETLTPAQYVWSQFGPLTPPNNVVLINGLGPTQTLPPNTMTATTTDSTTVAVLTLDGNAQSAANSIATGNYSLVSVRGTLMARDQTTGGGASWDVSSLFNTSTGFPTLVGSTVTQLQATGGFTLGTAPAIAASSVAGTQTFALTVKGVSGHTVNWTFTPVLGGV